MKLLVKIDWFTESEGGRKHIPSSGIYFCTTEVDNVGYTLSAKIELNINESNESLMEFLFFNNANYFRLNDIVPLYEGPKQVGNAFIHKIIL